MYCVRKVTEDLTWVGGNDRRLALFEGVYDVPKGVSYNSYLLMDEKTVLFDTVDHSVDRVFFENIDHVLAGRKLDALVVQHMEPDHAATIQEVVRRYPGVRILCNQKTANMMAQYFTFDVPATVQIVKEGDVFETGHHSYTFVMAPMVHWPEVMVTYEQSEKILFSADAFGKFGTLDTDEDWACEARRYYFNIVGKYGMPAQALLKKAAGLDIQKICALHGPILTENLEYYIGKYQLWSTYTPEDEGIFIAYCSLHGNTEKAAKKLAEILEAKGAPKVAISDLSRDDMAECIEDAFRYDRLVLAAPTYDGGVMPVMADFINHLKMKAYQKRKVAFIENGSWAPMAAKLMKEQMSAMKDIEIVDEHVTIRSAFKQSDVAALEALAGKLL